MNTETPNPENNSPYHRHQHMNGPVGGMILIVVGVIFLLQNLLNIDILGKLWPVLIIIVGIGVLAANTKRN